MVASLKKWEGIAELLVSASDLDIAADYHIYRDDPVGFARDVLKVSLTPKQEEILAAIVKPPYKFIVRSAHNVGKSYLAAVIILWFAACFREEGRLNSTASTFDQINEAVWGEVRALDASSGLGLIKYQVPQIKFGAKGVYKGFTATSSTAFQGRRNLYNGLIGDEAMGIKPEFFGAMESICGGKRFFVIYFFNPTDPASHLRNKEESGEYKIFVLNQEDHPNIDAGRRGLEPPYPSAITLDVHERQLMERTEPVLEDEPRPTDIKVGWRYGANGEQIGGEWRRPGFEAECRNLGRWPSSAVSGVWSPELWRIAEDAVLPDGGDIQIGVDVARKGDCFTVFCVRRGFNVEEIQSVQGWLTNQVAEQARAIAWRYGKRYGCNEKLIPIVIDDTGVGGGVTDQADGYNFIPLLFGSEALKSEWYYNKRAELWFDLAQAARYQGVSFRKLSKAVRGVLRNQALAGEYEYQNQRKKMRPKEEAAEKLNGRSPDEWESVLLAYAGTSGGESDKIVGYVQ